MAPAQAVAASDGHGGTTAQASPTRRSLRWLALGFAGMLAACAHNGSHEMSEEQMIQEADSYRARAHTTYTPPGPPEDPWGPYITEASQRFDVPNVWIREVMQRESGGQLYHNGQFVTSMPGAMGLMQLMPPTYDEMRARYNLGPDAFEPHDNIIAGTAYIREMYDIYGSPGFLAAYNSGPGRLDDFLDRYHTLPKETRDYVASIGPRIVSSKPVNRSQADLLVEARALARAQAAQNARGGHSRGRQLLASVPKGTATDTPSPEAAAVRAAWSAREQSGVAPMASAGTRPGVISMADRHDWVVQVGAYGSVGQAQHAAGQARAKIAFSGVHTQVATVASAHGHVYRARLTGLSHEAAQQVCQRLGGSGCQILPPTT
ncbi:MULTISPECIES: lytic transglycosylase domain-containing protein [Komagataeibacter]|uniref:Lytic transglycosylase domain-containing protein n=2 Tax=Komagataeibacter TaxID=1434011 RepID=A0A318QWC7_9PROT|nr:MULTISPECIES: lytic transglycosylase domain-containing protein [Komagataeibacter]MBL7232391.1 lytic transglycosylase domain-containing protein [Komagataeibacter oboediens]MBT0674670.1 lytic transglycosylase domain-containing protein [Komagataeibacter oboediens]MBT0677554.1 lytic transglycosylase domain-containing protein [Komagataeibacter oboediens]MBV1824479.1 lytic transglycosylase domain-containing protein [Komagataeibacter oboediens]PYD81838.1 murein transglycosylase [Komagataeibacter o